jgi:hypothetical protein
MSIAVHAARINGGVAQRPNAAPPHRIFFPTKYTYNRRGNRSVPFFHAKLTCYNESLDAEVYR